MRRIDREWWTGRITAAELTRVKLVGTLALPGIVEISGLVFGRENGLEEGLKLGVGVEGPRVLDKDRRL